MKNNKFYIHFSNGLTLTGLTELEMYKALYTNDFEELDKFNVLDGYNVAKLEVEYYGKLL